MELDRILLYSADELCRYVAARLKYRSACYSSSKLQWSGGILRCLNGMDCYLVFPVVSVRLLIVSEHRWLTLLTSLPCHDFKHEAFLPSPLSPRPYRKGLGTKLMYAYVATPFAELRKGLALCCAGNSTGIQRWISRISFVSLSSGGR